jgi:hypothetical protein
MKTKGIVGALALGAALVVLSSTAEARPRHWRHRHHGSFGVHIYTQAYPSYGYYSPYWGSGYGSDWGYGYRSSSWYDDDYDYPLRYRAYRAPRLSFHFHGSRRCYRSHRHHRFRW